MSLIVVSLRPGRACANQLLTACHRVTLRSSFRPRQVRQAWLLEPKHLLQPLPRESVVQTAKRGHFSTQGKSRARGTCILYIVIVLSNGVELEALQTNF
jgi:hypothetical protein